jgi:tartrate-resistant acid phosphatase type 5
MKISIALFLLTLSIYAKDLKHIVTKNIDITGQKICYLGDPGTGEEGQFKVARALEKENCTQIRIAGDMIYPTGLKSKNDKNFHSKFYLPYKKLIDSGVTFHIATGNHDYMGRPKLWNKFSAKHSWLTHPNLFYAEVYNDNCFITIDSTAVAQIYRIDRTTRQAIWLKKFREQYKRKCKTAILMGHHPNWSAGSHGDAHKIFQCFAKKRISGVYDMYIAGHDHNLSHEGEEKGTTFLVSGSAGKLRPLKYKPRGPFAKSVLGYIVVKIEKDQEKYFYNTQFKGVDSFDNPYLLFEETKQAKGLR